MENQTPDSSPFERMKKDEKHTVWGGYKTNSHAKLFSWVGGGCLLAAVASLLLLGLAIAISYQFAHLIFPKGTEAVAGEMQEKLLHTENKVNTLESRIRELESQPR